MNEKYPSEIPDYHERLGVKKETGYEEIKKAYKKLAVGWHPDLNPSRKECAHLEFITISEDFEHLYPQEEMPFAKEAPRTDKDSYDYFKVFGVIRIFGNLFGFPFF